MIEVEVGIHSSHTFKDLGSSALEAPRPLGLGNPSTGPLMLPFSPATGATMNAPAVSSPPRPPQRQMWTLAPRGTHKSADTHWILSFRSNFLVVYIYCPSFPRPREATRFCSSSDFRVCGPLSLVLTFGHQDLTKHDRAAPASLTRCSSIAAADSPSSLRRLRSVRIGTRRRNPREKKHLILATDLQPHRRAHSATGLTSSSIPALRISTLLLLREAGVPKHTLSRERANLAR